MCGVSLPASSLACSSSSLSVTSQKNAKCSTSLRKSSVAMLVGCLMLLTLSSCLGPRVKTETIVVHPGVPVQVLDQTKPRCALLDQANQGKQGVVDITGWIAMAPEDFLAWVAEYRRMEAELLDAKKKLSMLQGGAVSEGDIDG